MWLTTESGGDQHDPAPATIEVAVGEIEREDGFVILGRADQDYVQAAGPCLEYRQSGRHWRYLTPEVDRELVVRVFLSYYRDDGGWKTMLPWEDVTDEVAAPGQGRWQQTLVIAIVLSAVLALAAWFLLR